MIQLVVQYDSNKTVAVLKEHKSSSALSLTQSKGIVKLYRTFNSEIRAFKRVSDLTCFWT